MTSLDQIRTAIAARLASVGAAGRVHGYERWERSEKGLLAFYASPTGEIRGWNIRILSFRRSTAGGRLVTRAYWQLTGYLALTDASASEIEALHMAEAVDSAFRLDPTLGGLCIGLPVDGQAGLGIEVDKVMFGGALCHRLRALLATEHLETPAGSDIESHESAVPTLLDAVVTRLRNVAPPLCTVEGRLVLDAVADPLPAGLAYIVTPADESADPAATTLRVRQRSTVTFGVTLVAPDSYSSGEAALSALAVLRSIPRHALLGWGEAAGITDSPVLYVGGEPVRARPGVFAYRDSFSAATYYQQD